MAGLQRMYPTQEAIPEEYQDLYTERDGNWVLQLAGTDPYSKPVDEFNRILKGRDTEKERREELEAQIAALQEKLGSVDDDHIDRIAENLQRAEDAEQQALIAEKRYEEAADRKYQRQMAEKDRNISKLTEQVKQEQGNHEKLMKEFSQVKIYDNLRSQLLEAKADPQKLSWVIKAEAERWEINPETLEAEPIEWIDGGRTKITATGADGNPLTMREQAEALVRDNVWLALPSQGSGATHQTSSTNGSTFQMKESDAQGPGGHARYLQMKERAAKANVDFEIIPG